MAVRKMFCFQCEQTCGGKCCEVAGFCGKKPEIAALQDRITGAAIGLARTVEGREGAVTAETNRLVVDALFTTVTNVNFNEATCQALVDKLDAEKARLAKASGAVEGENYDLNLVWNADEDERSLKSLILFGIRGLAAYAYHAAALGYFDAEVDAFFYKALRAIGAPDASELLPVVLETGTIGYKCMGLLDKANTSTYGTPTPTEVTLTVEKGPFVVITGHDLLDLKKLLDQAQARGVNVYTHGEMLPANAYPEFKKYSCLKGNFGTAWQNQTKEFENLPAPILYTTNCLMPPRASYFDRVFTTGVVSFPGAAHIGEDKDFTPVLDKAIELGGFSEARTFPGINGGEKVTTGFSHGAVLSIADTVIDAVKSGAIRRFILVGGCDGVKKSRDYYTELVKQAPADTVVLTLACGKFRFNDLDIGTIGGLPRIMDMGQCNDAYGAIQVALALANAFNCGVNDLPLSLVLSWYEQKAVIVLLALLALGVRNILIGPTLPAFISPNVLNVLVEKFNIGLISTPEEDLRKIMG